MASPTETVQVTSNIPEWAKPYAERLLGESERLSRRGFQAYPGQMVEQFNPLQEQAFLDVAGMKVSPQIGQATGLAGLAGLRAQQMGQYNPYQAVNYYQDPQMREMGFDYDRVGTQSFTRPGATKDYMSPYMQGVVEQQKSQALRDYSRQIPGLQSAGIRSGARGGTREALLQAEAQRRLQDQLGGIQATGLQNAFQQGQQQFNTEQAARLQANLANQQARQGMQQMQLNQLQNLNQLGMQGAGQRAQYGLAGAQLGEQSRQFGAGLGMQGLAQQIAAAQALGGLGMNDYQQRMGINQAQLGAGSQIQALGQQDLASRYQQFLNEQQLPFQQLSWFSDILRGTPASGAIQQRYQAPPSMGGIIGGLGLAGLGGLLGGFGSGK